MSDHPTPDLIRAVRAGCHPQRCGYPDCCCDFPKSLRTALAELAAPSDAMLDAGYDDSHPVDGAVAYAVVDAIWRAMMRRVLGGDDAG